MGVNALYSWMSCKWSKWLILQFQAPELTASIINYNMLMTSPTTNFLIIFFS
jgi:hypothetical protein